MKKFVIGDIHGGLKALLQVLKKINCDENYTLIFLGDYVDEWRESSAVLDFLIELKTKKLLTKTENNIILILKKISLTADNRLGYFD